MAAVIDRCAFDEVSIDAALSLIEEVSSLPSFGARWLRKLARDGFAGEITVDVSNVLSLTLARGPLGQSRAPSDEDLRPLQWWASLCRGSMMRMSDQAVLSIEPYPVIEDVLVGGAEVPAFDALPALDRWGYRVPFAVAVALSSVEPGATSWLRAVRARARGASLDIVEIATGSTREGVRDALNSLAKSAGPRVALAMPFSESGGWGYIEAFNDTYPSDNYQPAVSLPDEPA